MKSVIQQVSRDVVLYHPIIEIIRDEKVWGPLCESLTRVDTIKGAVHNPIWVRNTTGDEND